VAYPDGTIVFTSGSSTHAVPRPGRTVRSGAAPQLSDERQLGTTVFSVDAGLISTSDTIGVTRDVRLHPLADTDRDRASRLLPWAGIHPTTRDFQGSSAAWITNDRDVWWVRFDARGDVLQATRAVSVAGRATAVSVDGRRVLVRWQPFDAAPGDLSTFTLLEVDPGAANPVPCASGTPGCLDLGPSCAAEFPWRAGGWAGCEDGAVCPSGTTCTNLRADTCPDCNVGDPSSCLTEGVNPVCLTPSASRVLGHFEGTDAVLIGSSVVVSNAPAAAIVIRFDANGLRVHEGLLPDDDTCTGPRRVGALLRCQGEPRSALYEHTPGAEPEWHRVTGALHGEARVAQETEAIDHVRVAGPHHEGVIDVRGLRLVTWRDRRFADDRDVVGSGGAHFRVGVNERDGAGLTGLGPSGCGGLMTRIDADGTTFGYELCGARHERAFVDGDVAWVFTEDRATPYLLDRARCEPLPPFAFSPIEYPFAVPVGARRLLVHVAQDYPSIGPTSAIGSVRAGATAPDLAYDVHTAGTIQPLGMLDAGLLNWSNAYFTLALFPARPIDDVPDTPGPALALSAWWLTGGSRLAPVPLRIGGDTAFLGVATPASPGRTIAKLEQWRATASPPRLHLLATLERTLNAPRVFDVRDHVFVVTSENVLVLRKACGEP